MEQNGNFSMEDARRIAESDAGQQLMSALRRNNGEQLKAAMAQASAGDYAQVQKTLSSALASPEIRELLKQLGGQYGG